MRIFVRSQKEQPYPSACGQIAGEVMGLEEANVILKGEHEATAERAQDMAVLMEHAVSQTNAHFVAMGNMINTLQEKCNTLHVDHGTQEHTTVLLNASVQPQDQ